MEEHNKAVSEDTNGLNGAKVTEVNGKMCVVHVIQPDDSVPRLSIMYNVDERQIKNFNSLIGDMIHHLAVLNIPMTESFKFTKNAQITEDQALFEEKARRNQALLMMGQYMAEC